MNYWSVYSYLKQVNGKISIAELVSKFPNVEMVVQGITEYNDMARKDLYYEEMEEEIVYEKA